MANAEYLADNLVELLRLLHCAMQNVHPRQVAEQAQGTEAAPEYDYSNRPFRAGQQRGWEAPGAPTPLLHFLGGVGQDESDEGAESPEISMSTRGLLNSISMLAEARSLRVVSKAVYAGDEGPARGGRRAVAKMQQLYLAPRARQLIMSAPTQGILLLNRPELLQSHV